MTGSPSFTTKAIDLTFKLGKGDFGAAGQNTLKVSGCRILAQLSFITGTGSTRGATQAILRVYGLTLNTINQLANTGLSFGIRQNTVVIEAGDASGMAQVFAGLIIDASLAADQQPDVAFMVSAVTAQDLGPQAGPAELVQGHRRRGADNADPRHVRRARLREQRRQRQAQQPVPAPGTLMMQMELVGKAADIRLVYRPGVEHAGDMAQERRARRHDPGDIARLRPDRIPRVFAETSSRYAPCSTPPSSWAGRSRSRRASR